MASFKKLPKIKVYWKDEHVAGIKLALVLLSIFYFAIIAAFLIISKNILFAAALLLLFAFIGLKPMRGIGLTMCLAVFQKGLSPLGFLNFPLFAVSFSATFLVWVYREALFLNCFRRTRIDIWVMLFFFFSALSAILSISFREIASIESLFPLLQLLALSIIIGFYLMGKEVLHGRTQISPILVAVLLAGMTVGLLGFADTAFGLSLFDNSYIKPYKEVLGYKLSVNRIISTFDNPNLLGMYLIYILPLCFYLAFDEKEEPKKWAMALVSLFLLFILWLTKDVSSWISLSYGISLVLLINLPKISRKWIAVIAIIGFAALGTFFLSLNSDRGQGRLDVLWPASIQIFLSHPLFGVGMGNYYFYYKQISSFDWNFAFHAHNLYLQILAERGIFALIFFIGMVAAFFISKLKYLILRPKSNHLTTALLLAMISILISGMMQHSFSWLGLELHFWLYIIITMGVIEGHIKWDI